MVKIVVLDGYSLNPGDLSWQGLRSLGDVTIYDRTPKNLIIERIKDASIIITNKVILNKAILSQCPHIKYIGVLATGYNIIDVDFCKDNNIIVTNIPTYGTEEVAQHVFALLLELTNHVKLHSDRVKEGKWAKAKDFCFWDKPIMSLNNKTIGIIGSGKIGMRTGEIAQAFGMKVILTNSKNNEATLSNGFSYVNLATLLKSSDVISLNCPLTDHTYEMINEASIKLMKPGVIIINTSRGQLINEEDLIQALESGQVSGCGLDVLADEPPINNKIIDHKNVMVTPHIAWAALEARGKLMAIGISNVENYLNNTIKNCVS